MKKEIANCGNCRFVDYEENNETQEIEEKCSIIRRYSEFNVNPVAKKLLKELDIALLCEYHLPAKGMEKRITYNLKKSDITPLGI
jgi:ribosome biogenesis GTPase A